MDINAPLLQQPHHRRAHRPLHKLAQVVTQFAQLFVEVLVLLLNQSSGFFKLAIRFLSDSFYNGQNRDDRD